MTMPASPLPLAEAASSEDLGAKRQQILDGANQVFMSKGFDAASMGEIARVSGVSKGTLYVYFQDKEKLFEAIVQNACRVHAEEVFELDAGDRDVAAVLMRMGVAYATEMCRMEGMASLRTVIAIAGRMPELGRAFYETGPAEGARKLKFYLDAQAAAGILRIDVTESDIIAVQFIDALTATTFKPMLFNFDAPSPQRIEQVVKVAVRTFLAAYGAK